jgi:hypothetical protein
MDQNKIASIRKAIHKVNILSPSRPQRPIQHFTPNTYKLLEKLREKTPEFFDCENSFIDTVNIIKNDIEIYTNTITIDSMIHN